MSSFSIENISKDIHPPKTKKYFAEVISSYQNENYRSAVVMLWSVAVCDIVYKLQHLVDIYNDNVARQILDEMNAAQEAQPTSSTWEITLFEEVFKKTELLDSPEIENLRSLQKQRHLSAHPILNRDRELHSPNKDTTRALLRNTLEGLLIKPPFYTSKILSELLTDLSETAEALNSREKVNQYLDNRYLRRLKPEAQIALFRAFWKFTFKLDNDECKKHRRLHLHVLECISSRQIARIPEAIQSDPDFYGSIASGGLPLTYMVFYIAKNSQIHQSLPEAARLKISHHIDNDATSRVLGWFVHDSLDAHFNALEPWITGDAYPVIDSELWPIILSFEDSLEWQRNCCKLMAAYYGTSGSYNSADSRFQSTIQPNLELFDSEAFHYLIKEIEANNQTYHRGRAEGDHNKIVAQIKEVDPEFDYSNYPHFLRLTED